jgi:uncharacterized protein (TIGR02271 family)
MRAGDEHDSTLQGIRKTIEELKASRPPASLSGTSKQPIPSEGDRPAAGSSDQQTIPVLKEQPNVTKEVKDTGSITFRKRVHSEDISVDDTVSHEEVSIERVPVERRYVDENPPGIRREGNTTIVPVFHEVVEKQLILLEEIHISKRKRHAIASEPLSLYKEELDIKQDSSQNSSAKDGIENRDQG